MATDNDCANAWTAIREAVKRQMDAGQGTVGEQVAALRAFGIFGAVAPFLALPDQERKIALADPLLAVAEKNAADLREAGVLGARRGAAFQAVAIRTASEVDRQLAPRRMTAAWLEKALQSQIERAAMRRMFRYLRDAPDVAGEMVQRIRERNNVRTACEFIEGLGGLR